MREIFDLDEIDIAMMETLDMEEEDFYLKESVEQDLASDNIETGYDDEFDDAIDPLDADAEDFRKVRDSNMVEDDENGEIIDDIMDDDYNDDDDYYDDFE